MRTGSAVIAAVFGLTAAACGSDDEVVLTPEAARAEVAVGADVVIELDENPSVGDDWQIEAEPAPAVAVIIEDDFVPDDPDGDRDGAGGVRRIVVEAVGEGETNVVVHNCYRCDAEGNSPPDEEEFAVDEVFTIVVSAG